MRQHGPSTGPPDASMTPHEEPPARPSPRAALMEQHAAARRRREQSRLGSDEFRAAAEEVARIEIEIARLEEPPPVAPDEPSAG